MGKLTYFSHSAWLIETEEATIAIDPFLNDNPNAPLKADELKCNYIILTHAHGDHYGDTIQIAKANDALIITNFECSNYCQAQGTRSHPLSIGGGYNFPFGRVKLTPAWHSSSFPDGTYGGMPAGCVISLDGKNIYHAGDTGLFADMKLVGEHSALDIAIVPIGDNFTMGIDDAVIAIEYLQPKLALPMHYNTFEIIQADPHEFVEKLKARGFEATALAYGASLEF